MRCNQSREERFNELYTQYKNDVYRVSLYITKNSHDAEDITQKVYCKLYEYMDRIDETYVHAYLVRAAKNLSYNLLRDTKWEREGVSLDTLTEAEDFAQSAEEAYLKKEKDDDDKELSSELMKRLYEENEMWYHILNLVYCLGVSHDDAAKSLGISKTVLYSRLYRAKQWIQKHFREEYEKE